MGNLLNVIMESSSSFPIVIDTPGVFRLHEDGTVERLVDSETVPPSTEDDNFDEEKEEVVSKDVVLDPQTGVSVRFYLPRFEITDGKTKIPIILYFHEGGLCIGSAASLVYHHYLIKLTTEARVICLSVDYRRPPNHCLPAAYDDCFALLEWLDRQALALDGVSVDPWLSSHADFSKVFLAGDSAGANILHQVVIRASGRSWDGVCLQGAIVVHPFFGGEERVGCELRAEKEVEAFHMLTEAIWSISLPAGADRDHPFRNPVGPRSATPSSLVYPRTLVFVAEKDLLRDRGILYYEWLKKAGKDVDFVMTEGESHIFHLFNPQSDNVLLMLKRISEFVHSSSDHPN